MKEVKCISVGVDEFMFGPGAQIDGLLDFLKNPKGRKAVLRVFDENGGEAEITLRIDEDDRLVVGFGPLNEIGFYLAEPSH